MNIDFSEAVEQLDGMVDTAIRLIPNLLVAIIVFIVFVAAARSLREAVRRVAVRYGRPNNLSLVLGRLAEWLVILLGILAASVVLFPNFTPSKVIELLGISSVAIGFAFRDILQNFLAGILLLITEPFRIGDQIMAGDYEGTVEDIQTRATMIRTYDGRRVVIPNADLFTGSVIVNTAYPIRRLEYDFGIGYDDDIRRAKSLVLDALHGLENVLDDPAPDVLVMELGDYSVILRVRWWIQPPRRIDALDTRDQVLMAVKEALLTNGITMPYPMQYMIVDDDDDMPHPGEMPGKPS